ncbi:MAG: ABC transporter substrate-binding protein [Chloroflexi bacterium]|nr:ABC transporter substrate-binding protein [Chloroflexota bacterium]
MNKKRSLVVALAVILAVSMLIGACSKGQTTTTGAAPTTAATTRPATTTGAAPTTAATTRPATTTVQPTTTAAAAPKGELRIAVLTFDQDRFDPATLSRTTNMLFAVPTFDHLIRLDNGKLIPGLADSWEMAPDGLSWIFRIHKGVKFHNGEDLKADDVKFSFERFMLPIAPQSEMRNGIERVEIVDDYTVRVHTKGPQPYFATFVSYYSPAYGAIQPKDYIEARGVEYFTNNPIGSGPWKMIRHDPGDSVKWEAVPNHWQRPPAFKELSLLMVPEEATRVAMLKTGAIDMTNIGLDSAEPMQKAGFKVTTMSSQQTYVLLIGALSPESGNLPTTDIRVRKALSLAIDRNDLQKNYLRGQGSKPLPGYIPVEAADDSDIPYWEDQAQKSYARFNLDEAKKMLADAGYSQGLSIKIWGNNMGGGIDLPKIAEIVQGYWSKIGVKAELVPSDWGTTRPIANINKTPNTPIRGNALMMRVGGRPVTSQIFSAHITTTGTVGILGMSWPDVDKVVQSIANEMDVAKRRAIVASTIQRVADQWVALPIGGMPALAAISPNIDYSVPFPTDELTMYAHQAKPAKK